MGKILLTLEDELKAFYEKKARELAVEEDRRVSLSELIRRALLQVYGKPSKKKVTNAKKK